MFAPLDLTPRAESGPARTERSESLFSTKGPSQQAKRIVNAEHNILIFLCFKEGKLELPTQTLLSRATGILTVGMLTANVLCIAWLCFKHYRIDRDILLYISLIALVGGIFALVNAPDIRFSLGYYLVIPVLTCASFLLDLSSTSKGAAALSILKAPLLLIAAYFAVAPMINDYLVTPPKAILEIGRSRNIWIQWVEWPARPIKIPALAYAQANNFKYSWPEDGLCWGAELPCAFHEISNTISLRDENAGFSKGFVNKPPD